MPALDGSSSSWLESENFKLSAPNPEERKQSRRLSICRSRQLLRQG